MVEGFEMVLFDREPVEALEGGGGDAFWVAGGCAAEF